MRSWVARTVVVACLAALVVVVGSGTAGAASAFRLLTVDAQGPLPGDTTSVTASEDASIVAFAQSGATCAASTVFVRNRPAATTTAVGAGVLPAITADGSHVAYVSCGGATPEVAFWNGTTSVPITAGQWRQGGADTIKDLAVAPSGGFVAFTASVGAAPASSLWLAKTDGSSVVKVAAAAGDVLSPSLSDSAVAFVAATVAYSAPFTDPGAPTRVPAPAGAVTGVSISKTGQTVAVSNGAGVYASVAPAGPVLVTAGASDPSVTVDGGTVAVTMSNGSVAAFTVGATPTLLATATPIAAGGFSAGLASDRGRQIVFLAKEGSAAGGSASVVQAFAIGPDLATTDTAFGDVGVGTTTVKAVTFTNDGTVAVTPTEVTSSNPTEFVVTAAATTCLAGQAIAVGASCVVQVSLTPSAAGARTGALTVVQQDGTWDLASATSNLTATAVNGDLSADPTAIDFGAVTVGASSSARTFTVTNSGSLATTIGTLLVSGGQASEFPLAGGTCAGAALQPAQTCTVSVFFKPSVTGGASASLDVGGSSGASVSVALSGSGTNPAHPALSASPTSLAFGVAVLGSPAPSQTVTVKNSGNVANTPTATVTGADSGDFALTGNGCTGRSLAAGSSCTVTVGFDPTAAGARSATLAVSGTGGSSASVKLSGTGQLNPTIAVSPGVVTAGQVVTVLGTNFPAGGAVSLAWDSGGGAIATVADAGGNLAMATVVPRGFGNGTRVLVVVSPPEATALQASVLVQSPAPGFEGAATPAFTNSPAHT